MGAHPFTTDGLAGHWRLERRIDDRRGGGVAHLDGRAEFAPQSSGLVYRETGRLTLPDGQSFEARQSHLWRFPSRDRVEVYFADGRFFHDFAPGAPEAEHLCGDDLYRVRYAFDAAGWSTLWQVTGPRKDQSLLTRYSRS